MLSIEQYFEPVFTTKGASKNARWWEMMFSKEKSAGSGVKERAHSLWRHFEWI